MQLRSFLLFAGVAGLLGAPRPASAEPSGFASERFEPSDRGSDWFVSDSLDFRGSVNVAAGTVFDWSYRPLVLRHADAGKEETRAVIMDRVLAHAGISALFRDRFRFALDLPIVIYQDGEGVSQVGAAVRTPSGPGVGDLRLSGDWRALGQYGDVFTAALGMRLYVPTGKQAQLTSDGTFRIAPHLSIAGDGEGLVYAAKLGFAYRPLDATFDGRKLGSEAVFSVAAGVRVNDLFVLGPELYGSSVVTHGTALGRRETPLELLLGLHVNLAQHWQLGSAIGPGLTRGDGTPLMRVLLSVEYAPDVCVDKDGDGICANVDACPDVDGVKTGERRTNGCPGDRDHDGVNDKDDACREQPGIHSDDPTKNGCPAGTEQEPAKAVKPD